MPYVLTLIKREDIERDPTLARIMNRLHTDPVRHMPALIKHYPQFFAGVTATS